MSSLFVLLDYFIIILISTLYNPSHCLFVDQIGGEVYVWFGCIVNFKIDALCCCFSALESTWLLQFYVCVLLSFCYTCFVYASIMCYMTFQVQVLWWRMIKVMFMVLEHTPYSNSWQVKIHDLCKVSCICSSYVFGFIRPKWDSKHAWGNAKVWMYFIMHFPSLWKMICFEK